MRRIWIFACLAACCAALIAWHPFGRACHGKILLMNDPLDPLAELIEPYAGNSIERLNPYRAGLQLPGMDGMAFAYGTQARPYKNPDAPFNYEPLSTATAVIAVNRNGNSAGAVKGWQTLLESEAVVALPHHSTECGRLMAIALAKGLGAEKGDLTPAIRAFAHLQSQGRLNSQDEYRFYDYWAVVPPERLAAHDAILLWDYQAAALNRISDHWELIVPEEGLFSVDCGFVCGEASEKLDDLRLTREFLYSERGRQALAEAGFSPLAGEVDLSAWDTARLGYNPGFRRAVLSIKLLSPASLQERLFLQGVTLLLVCIAAQRILRRIPGWPARTASFLSILLVLLWMFIGMVKSLSLNPDLIRYCWLATYLPRHFLPAAWFCMCYVDRHDRLPARRTLITLLSVAFLLTVLVLSNDLHRLVFIYTHPDPAYWDIDYRSGWAYYLSLAWTFSLIIAGLAQLTLKNRIRRQKRQMQYAGVLLLALLAYQGLYLAGVQHIIDLDIPTTVAILILAFNLAAQQERFMGASLLGLPMFQNSPHAIAIYNAAGQTVYANAVMESLPDKQAPASYAGSEGKKTAEVWSGERVFKPRLYTIDAGQALILEDITELRRLERRLAETQRKLESVQGLLVRQTEAARSLTSRLEQERYSLQMEHLFKEKLEQARWQLGRISAAAGENMGRTPLCRARFLLCICQQRLSFIIRSLEAYPLLPAELIARYADRVVRDGRRVGLDGVVTAAVRGFCPAGIVALLLEAIDAVCLYALGAAGSSVICRLDADNAGFTLNILLSWGEGVSQGRDSMLPEDLVRDITGLGGQVRQASEGDGLLARLYFAYEEVRL